MAIVPANLARDAATPGATDALVEAKLAPPFLRADVLPRDGLVRRLLDAQEPLVTLLAPAGYGKTTTLALWRAREPRPVAWLTADAADEDPVRFLAHLSAAIARATGIDVSAVDEQLTSATTALSGAVPRLSSALFRAGKPLLIIVDDVHRVPGTATTDALAMLMGHLPPRATLAVAGRADAGLPVARFRAAGRLLEIAVPDLAFDEGEAAHVVAQRGRELSSREARDLRAATEGWPAAVYLAARHAPGGATVRGASIVPSGRDADIAEYLDSELLDGVAPRVRSFMLRTSVLERMTADLCDEVTGGRGSERILRTLAATNSLVAPLDVQGGWYRYHPLLREHLLDRLRRRPVVAADCHRRAAAWFARTGRGDMAVEHLFAAGDPDAAASLAAGLALPLSRRGRDATVVSWIARFSADDLRRHPYLAVFAALAASLAGRTREAERMLDLAERAAYAEPRPPGADEYEAARAAVSALVARHGLPAAIADAEAARAGCPPHGQWRSIADVILGSILVVAGDRDRGDAILRDVGVAARAVGASRAAVLASAWRAMLAMERDEWDSVERLVREALDSAGWYSYEPDATTTVGLVVAARAAVHRGDAPEARRHLAAFQMARPSLGPATPWLSARCLLEAARAHLALADPAGARSCLVQASDIVTQRGDLGDLPGQVAALRERIRRLPPGPGGASTLTPAEIRVLRLLPTYLTASDMAERLFVSTNTVRTQIQSIYGKLGAASRAEAVDRAIEAGLLEPLPVLADGLFTTP